MVYTHSRARGQTHTHIHTPTLARSFEYNLFAADNDLLFLIVHYMWWWLKLNTGALVAAARSRMCVCFGALVRVCARVRTFTHILSGGEHKCASERAPARARISATLICLRPCACVHSRALGQTHAHTQTLSRTICAPRIRARAHVVAAIVFCDDICTFGW